MRSEIEKSPQTPQSTSTEELLAEIERLRAANSALCESEEHFRALAEIPFGGVIISEDGVIVQVNPQFARIYGYEPSEVVGQDVTRFLVPQDASRAMDTVLSSEECVAEYRGIRKDGTLVFLEAHGRPRVVGGRSCRVTILRDITDRKQAEEALRRYELLSAHSRDIILFLRRSDGRILEANLAAAEAYGYSREELLSHTVFDLRAPGTEDLAAEQMTEADAHGILFTTTHRRKDGSIFPVEVSSQGATLGGERTLLSVVRDTTERDRAEREREATIELLRLANVSDAPRELVAAALAFFQEQSGCEAVGLRLVDGDDYPYFEARGFPPQFIEAENSLCRRDGSGQICRDESGNPVLECMCGNVICERFSPLQPYYTPRGSFWTNSTTELLAGTRESDRQARTRDRCNGEGYESVALIPLRVGGERLGLLQLNDRRKGMFSPEGIVLWERLADQLAITLARLRSEEARRRSETLYRAIARSVPDGAVYVIDREQRYLVVDGPLGSTFGYPNQGIEGRTLREVLDEDAARRVEERCRRAMAGEAASYEEVNRGRALWTQYVPLRDEAGNVAAAMALVLDVTAREQAEERMAALQRITAALSAAPTPEDVCRAALEQAVPVLGARSGAVALLEGETEMTLAAAVGYPAEVVSAFRRFHRDARVPTADAVRAGRPLLFGSPEALRAAYPSPAGAAGSSATAALAAFPVGIEGRILGAMCLSFTDPRSFDAGECAYIEAITGQVAQALERARLFDAERRAQEELREADRRKDEFLAMLAHELRNPLAAISSAVYLIGMLGVTDPAQQRAQRAAARQTQHMARILDDLLDVSRITRGKVTLRKDAVALATAVESALETARPLVEGKGQELFVSLPDEPLQARGDLVRLTQVLSNLLSNASRYTPVGGHVWLTARRRGSEALVTVRDDGMGIAPDLLPHVFDLFVQGDRSPDRSQGGLGIGLTLVRSLVEMHGGCVTAQSDGLGRGSEFAVRLPLLDAGCQARGAEAEPSPAPQAMNHPKRILVVDDSADAAQTLAMVLETDGREVVVAGSGPEALALAAEYRPDVMLLDIGMPGMDGYDVARRVRQDPHLADTLLIALTGYGQDEDRARACAAGFDHHLVKPVDMGALQRLLAGADGRRQRQECGTPTRPNGGMEGAGRIEAQ